MLVRPRQRLLPVIRWQISLPKKKYKLKIRHLIQISSGARVQGMTAQWASPRKASALQQEYLGSSLTWGSSAVPKTVCLQQVNNQNSNSIGNQSHNDPINENCAP